MNKHLKSIKILSIGFILLCSLFACRKKYPYFFPDGTPGNGADSASISVDTSMSGVDVSKYPQARVFPGLVGDQVPRLKDYEVSLDLDYHYVGSTLRISVPPQPLFSVGLYAPAGELIEITVPEALRNLSVQIGAWTDNLSNKLNPKRDPVVISRQKLAPGKNYIRNLYGGTIYIISPRPVNHPVTLSFTGAVKSPDFILGKTDPAEWWENLKKTDVPWLELRSPNFIATVPRDKFLRFHVTNPRAALSFWNEVVKNDYYGWEGLTKNATDPLDQAPLMPYRAVLDIDISVGYGHNGFPVMFVNDQYWFKSVTDSATVYSLDTWGSHHEIGHNNQQGLIWSWSVLGETTNNLFIFKTAHRLYPDNLTEVIAGLHNMQGQGKATMDFVRKTGKKDFDAVGDPFFYIVPFLQIFRKAGEVSAPGSPGAAAEDGGWDFMPFLYSRARHAERISFNDQDKKDFLYEAISDYTHKDFKLFFNAWGISVSNYSQSIITKKGYPLLTKKIWAYNPMTDTGGTGIYDPYIPAYWDIAGFSSEQKTGEGQYHGLASNVIDGNPDSYWHSEYNPGMTYPPHFLSIDMGVKLAVKSFVFEQRKNGSRNIKNIEIQTSDNGEDWQSLGTYQLDKTNNAEEQKITFPQILNFRYFKLIVHSRSDVYDGTQFAALAEVWVEAP